MIPHRNTILADVPSNNGWEPPPMQGGWVEEVKGPGPVEAARAEAATRRIAAGMGLGDRAAVELLQALGLAPYRAAKHGYRTRRAA